jgi:hypothetical protein
MAVKLRFFSHSHSMLSTTRGGEAGSLAKGWDWCTKGFSEYEVVYPYAPGMLGEDNGN